MELIRGVLLHVESNAQPGMPWIAFQDPEGFGGHPLPEVIYHVDLLFEAELVKGNSEMPLISSLTWKGHEFLDDTRDPDIWERVKERAKGLPEISIALVWELAKAELRKKLGL